MHYEISVSQDAEAEILVAYLYYEEMAKGSGERLLEAIDSAYKLITAYPGAFPERPRNTRAFFLKKYPFHIHYRVGKNTVRVIAFFHQSRAMQGTD